MTEISCNPKSLANYFTKSDLPYEVTPAFFKPEVLRKYKADPEKYRLEDRSISCRGAWHLETYDINEAGQVHTYLIYLSRLPYQEQLYWKSFNEPPKAPISRRAVTTDFEGQFDERYDPLSSLKHLARELRREDPPWWKLRSEDLLDRVHYPATNSAEEWANELLLLDQLLVEGFEEKWLRGNAAELGRALDPTWRSLKLIEECLIGHGFEQEHARSIVSPLHELHNLRSKLKGHASGETAAAIKSKVLGDHSSYRKHFEALCAGCDSAMQEIVRCLRAPDK